MNNAVHAGLTRGKRHPFKQRSFETGFYPHIYYDRISHLIAALEDEEIIQKLEPET